MAARAKHEESGASMRSLNKAARTYLPAAGYDWLLPLYDPCVKLLGIDRFRSMLLDQAAIRPGYRILDIGCGTGTLAVTIKRRYPDVEVGGIDPDSNALERARRKARRANLSIQFDQGFSNDLPYPDVSFDRILSSFMFHHIEPGDKERTLAEVRRTLKPGGEFHLLDFGGSSEPSGFLAHLFHSHSRLKDNFGGRILTLMAQAGLPNAQETAHRAALFGSIARYRATASSE
jgi:ubiquinone/menaquinone biosynthesis C-methylase UbiE